MSAPIINMINLSRNKKHIFSNPCSFKEFSVSMIHTSYLAKLRWIHKHKPEQLEEIKHKKFLCLDGDCWPRVCHIKLLKNFLNKHF